MIQDIKQKIALLKKTMAMVQKGLDIKNKVQIVIKVATAIIKEWWKRR